MGQPLLTSQRNAVLLAIRQVGLDPRGFSWTEFQSKHARQPVSRLNHRDTGFYFVFDFKGEEHFAIYSPGGEIAVTEQFPGDWKSQFHYFQLWLTYLKREIEAPDLWQMVSESADLIADAASPARPSGTFTAAEQAHVRQVFNEVLTFIRASQNLTQERLDAIEDQLEYLAESAARSSRRDWGLMLLGTIVNIITSAAIPPDGAQTILQIIGAGLRWLFQGSPLLPTPLP